MSLSEQLYELIVEAILTNEYQPGEILQIDKLASSYGVSSTPVREALVKLEGAELVKLIPNKGAQVSDISARHVFELWEVRAILEPYVARIAVVQLELDEIGKICAELSHVIAHPEDFQAYIDSDIGLHELLFKRIPNKLLTGILEKLAKHYTRIRYYAEMNSPTRSEDIVIEITLEHLKIAQALLARDGDLASKEVSAHLENGKKRTLTAFGTKGS